MKRPTNDSHITIDGQPLAEYLDLEHGREIKSVQIKIVTTINKSIRTAYSPRSLRSGTGSGRSRGNPGVKRSRSLTREEIAAENIRRGLS